MLQNSRNLWCLLPETLRQEIRENLIPIFTEVIHGGNSGDTTQFRGHEPIMVVCVVLTDGLVSAGGERGQWLPPGVPQTSYCLTDSRCERAPVYRADPPPGRRCLISLASRRPSPAAARPGPSGRRARQMRSGAAPRPVTRIGDQTGTHRIQFHVPRGRKQVRFVHHERSETPLPQIAPPFFTEVDSTRIAPVRLADGPPQTILRLWHRNQVDMIGHQAVSPPRSPHHWAISST